MKKSLSYLLLAVLLAAVLIGAFFAYRYLSQRYQPQTPSVSEDAADDPITAPDFTVLDQNGTPVHLSDYFGTPIVINFWATWCGPCKAELPAYNNVFTKYSNEVKFLMVNLTDGVQETVEGVNQFLDENNYDFPVFFDTNQEAAYAYGISSVPMTVLIYADGTAAGYWVGAVDETTLEHYVNLLIKGDIHEDQAES